MSLSLKKSLMVSIVCAPIFAACGGEAADGNEDDSLFDGSELGGTSLSLPANGTASFTVTSTGVTDKTITVDCKPPSDPDALGTVFKVSAKSLGIPATDPPRAGAWAWAGKVPSGTQTLTLTNLGAAASCSVKTSVPNASATCKTWTAFRSPNLNHTHIKVGSDASQDWEVFPTSGNHWGSWAKWSTVYQKPIKRGFLLHNLEHGGLVLSYKCNAASDSAACKDASDQLIALANSFGQPRIIVTPDPTQPEMFAIRAWRWGYSSECLDTTTARSFASKHYRHGREDIDASPPIPFDPTTLNVPCQDLMAAPDSCPQ